MAKKQLPMQIPPRINKAVCQENVVSSLIMVVMMMKTMKMMKMVMIMILLMMITFTSQ